MATTRHNHLRALCEGAIMLAIGVILNYLRLYRMPWGGSIDLAMIPIIIYAVRWGTGRGLLVGAVFGLLQYVIGNGFGISWESLLGDYLIAYLVVGLAGLMMKTKYGAIWGSLVGGGARFAVHYLVGATVWAQYMPENFLGLQMTSPWIYSALYNGVYMIPNIALAVLVTGLMYLPLGRQLRGEDIAR